MEGGEFCVGGSARSSSAGALLVDDTGVQLFVKWALVVFAGRGMLESAGLISPSITANTDVLEVAATVRLC